MRRFVVVIAVVTAGILMLPAQLADRVEDVRGSVVHIRASAGWEGSGWAVAPGVICTARHVVEDGGEFIITTDDGVTHTATHAVISEKYDLAFLRVDAALKPLKLGPVPRVGDRVFIMGSPLGYDHFNSVSLGIVAAAHRSFADFSGWDVLFQTTGPAFPGNSGGPVFDTRGRVVGVLVGGCDATLNYAVPTGVIDLEAIAGAFLAGLRW